MYYLREMIGEDAVNRALRKVLDNMAMRSRRIRRRGRWWMRCATRLRRNINT